MRTAVYISCISSCPVKTLFSSMVFVLMVSVSFQYFGCYVHICTIWHHLSFFHMHRCFKYWYLCPWGHLNRKEQRPPATVRWVTSLSTLETENLANNYRESSAACQQGLLDLGYKSKPSACVFSLSSMWLLRSMIVKAKTVPTGMSYMEAFAVLLLYKGSIHTAA